MTNTSNRFYKAAVFDWAGTIIDYGSLAPTAVFTRLFETIGIDVTDAEARGPMGLPKRNHIAAMLEMPRIRDAYIRITGHEPGDDDVSTLYAAFLPLNLEVATDYANPIPGAVEAVAALRQRGLKIGSTTGYGRQVMEAVIPIAARHGYSPDNVVCGDDLAESRPGPVMMYRCFADLAVYPPEAVIKIDDTPPGIAEGKAAGCLTVGVSVTGNGVGLTEDEWHALSPADQQQHRQAAEKILLDAGADHVIDSVADLPDLIDRLESLKN